MKSWQSLIAAGCLTTLLSSPSAGAFTGGSHPAGQSHALPIAYLLHSADARIALEDESQIYIEFDVEILNDQWVDIPLLPMDITVSNALLDGEALALSAEDDRWRHGVFRGKGHHHIQIWGVKGSLEQRLDLNLARAMRTRITLPCTQWQIEAQGLLDLGQCQFGRKNGESMAIQWAKPKDPPPLTRQISHTRALALRFDENAIHGQAKFRYEIRHGQVSELNFTLPTAVDELKVSGPQVKAFSGENGQIRVELFEKTSGAIPIEIAYRAAPLASGKNHGAPIPMPVEGRGEGYLTLFKTPGLTLLPTPSGQVDLISASKLPKWAKGLLDGQSVATYHLKDRQSNLDYQLLQWQAIDGPPVLVDEAHYTMAYADHGRGVLRARFQVRNEKEQYLTMAIPARHQLLGVKVAGHLRQPVIGSDGLLYIPLEKSVETLKGLVSFPVEVMLLFEEMPWDGRGQRDLQSPAISAPIARAKWEVYLPPTYQSRRIESQAKSVESWVQGQHTIQLGRAFSLRGNLPQPFALRKSYAMPAPEMEIAEEVNKEASISVWNQAYDAYQGNRFDEAEALLEESLDLDPQNASAQALMGNLSVLNQSPGQSDDDEAQARRIREMARAKYMDTEQKQATLQAEADEKMRSGEYEEAVALYESLVDITDQLATVEEAEQMVQKEQLSTNRAQLDQAKAKLKRRKSDSNRAAQPPPAPAKKRPKASGVLSANQSPDRDEMAPMISLDQAAEADGDKHTLANEPALYDYRAPVGGSAKPQQKLAKASNRNLAQAPLPQVRAREITAVIPKRGKRLRFEQLLVPEGHALEAEIRYRQTLGSRE